MQAVFDLAQALFDVVFTATLWQVARQLRKARAEKAKKFLQDIRKGRI